MFGLSEARHGSAMEYIAGYDMYLSKAAHLDDDFRALGIEPYLTYVAEQHPDHPSSINATAEALYDRQSALVHRDASPKNFLFRDANPILLDAECATMGDSAIDPAFCLNHLLLKTLHMSGVRHPRISGEFLANLPRPSAVSPLPHSSQ